MSFFGRCGLLMLSISCLLAACSPANNAPLPTLAEVPSAVAEVTATETAVTQRVTLPPTWTITPTATLTPSLTLTTTPSVTPSATITDTPSPTVTDLPTVPPEERPLTSLLLDAIGATVLPTDYVVPGYQGTEITLNAPITLQAGTPSVVIVATAPGSTGLGSAPTPIVPAAGSSAATCSFLPPGGFGSVYNNNPDIAASLGCPQGAPPDVSSQPAAVQTFQQGIMIWLQGDIYVLKAGANQFRHYEDTFLEGTDPANSTETPPSGLFAPVRGFLKIWSTYTDVRTDLGWAINQEVGVQATVMLFARGMMLWLPGRSDILVFMSSDSMNTGTWRSFAGQF